MTLEGQINQVRAELEQAERAPKKRSSWFVGAVLAVGAVIAFKVLPKVIGLAAGYGGVKAVSYVQQQNQICEKFKKALRDADVRPGAKITTDMTLQSAWVDCETKTWEYRKTLDYKYSDVVWDTPVLNAWKADHTTVMRRAYCNGNKALQDLGWTMRDVVKSSDGHMLLDLHLTRCS